MWGLVCDAEGPCQRLNWVGAHRTRRCFLSVRTFENKSLETFQYKLQKEMNKGEWRHTARVWPSLHAEGPAGHRRLIWLDRPERIPGEPGSFPK